MQPLGFDIEDFELLRHNLATKVCANGRRYFQVGKYVYELVETRQVESEIPKFSVMQRFRIPKLSLAHWTASLGKFYFDEASLCLVATNCSQLFKYSQEKNNLRPMAKNECHDVF